MSGHYQFHLGEHPDNATIVRVVFYHEPWRGHYVKVRTIRYIDLDPRWHTRRRFGAV